MRTSISDPIFDKIRTLRSNQPPHNFRSKQSPHPMYDLLQTEFNNCVKQYNDVMKQYPGGVTNFVKTRIKEEFGDFVQEECIDLWSIIFAKYFPKKDDNKLESEIMLELFYMETLPFTEQQNSVAISRKYKLPYEEVDRIYKKYEDYSKQIRKDYKPGQGLRAKKKVVKDKSPKDAINEMFKKYLFQFFPLMFQHPKGIGIFIERRLKEEFKKYIKLSYIEEWSKQHTKDLLGSNLTQETFAEIDLEMAYVKKYRQDISGYNHLKNLYKDCFNEYIDEKYSSQSNFFSEFNFGKHNIGEDIVLTHCPGPIQIPLTKPEKIPRKLPKNLL